MKHLIKTAALLLAATLLLCACGGGSAGSTSGAGASSSVAPSSPGPASSGDASTGGSLAPNNAPFMGESPAINGGVLGAAYGAKGNQQQNGVPTLSPAVLFQNPPEGTVCYALLMTDPDAEAVAGYIWNHWLAANIPADLADNASQNPPAGMVQGTNSFGTVGYGGPTPPSGTHTYVFQVWALSEELPLEKGFDEKELLAALEGRELASAVFQGDYSA